MPDTPEIRAPDGLCQHDDDRREKPDERALYTCDVLVEKARFCRVPAALAANDRALVPIR
jgi:hypothetical protein